MNAGVSIQEASKVLGRSPGAIRRWIRQGAPCVEHSDGQGGRGRGSVVDPAALSKWYTSQRLRSGSATRGGGGLARLAPILFDFLRREGGGLGDLRAHEVCGIPEHRAAAYLTLLFRYAYIRRHSEPPERYPEIIVRLIAFADDHE